MERELSKRKTTEIRTDKQLAADLEEVKKIARRWEDNERAKAVMERRRREYVLFLWWLCFRLERKTDVC